MLAEERRQKIMELLYREGKVSNLELSERLCVSDETVRRDLAVLEAICPVRKVHGGAVLARQPYRDESYEQRRVKGAAEKRLIAAAAAKHIADNDIIGIDSGTGAEAIADAISGVRNLRVITNALPVAEILSRKLAHGDFSGKVYLVGGELHPETASVTGAVAVEFLRKFTFHKAFLGATAISEQGVSVWDENDGTFSAALVSAASCVIAYAESEKLGRESFYRVCPLDKLSLLISDGKIPPPDSFLAALAAADVTFEIAKEA